jgi:hypothetical protein
LQRREEVEGPLEKTTSPRGPPDFKTSLSKKERKKEPKPLFPFPLPSSSGYTTNNNNYLNEKKPIIILLSSSFFSSVRVRPTQ